MWVQGDRICQAEQRTNVKFLKQEYSGNSEATEVTGPRTGDENRRQTGPQGGFGYYPESEGYWWEEGKAVTSSVTMCSRRSQKQFRSLKKFTSSTVYGFLFIYVNFAYINSLSSHNNQ